MGDLLTAVERGMTIQNTVWALFLYRAGERVKGDRASSGAAAACRYRLVWYVVRIDRG
jgi:hypothetical protein